MQTRRPAHAAPRAAASLVVALVALVGVGATPARAITAHFPTGYEGFHTYAEMVADITAVQAAYPDIVQLFSIGKSYQGRELWAAKVSDNVGTDESEPEVLYDGLHHSDEHMGLEMTLSILHWLTDGYGTDARITRIVDAREVWIVFGVNPDGAEYDIRYATFHHWRKNRQPNAGTTAVGTDLNRNYSYRWTALSGLTSTNPRAITYRGPAPFSAPETQAMRAFLASRVVDGRQQIRTAITFHEYGRLVMWPYGYTYANVPPDMTAQDHAALVAIGRRMAASNGYRPLQASDNYPTSGTARDYAYGAYRIFSYTFELSNVDYPKDTVIRTETARNRNAVLYLAEVASCPYAILGVAAKVARCGAFDDDLEVARGWVVDPDGTDTAPAAARFARADPAASSGSGTVLQAGTTTSGRAALVTGAATGATAGAADLDGVTSVRSPAFSLPAGTGQTLSFRWSFAHLADASIDDHLRIWADAGDGTRTLLWSRSAAGGVAVAAAWQTASVPMDAWAGQSIRLVIEAADGGTDSTVEVAVDDVRVTRPTG